ncbi:MAG: hypothetical protein JWR26_1538 [Pedosphaera sp.]|nr:hypothetical protein [Pedosphaera sp.]
MESNNTKRPAGVGQSGSANNLLNRTVVVEGLSNQEFLERYAQPGRVGLSGGVTLIDKAIARAERHIDEAGLWGSWSHAFLFQGSRHDGHHWVIESDLQVNRKHVRLGVQENRISKYFDEGLYTTLAVLDFGLTEEHVGTLLREGLELVASRARYSLRELLGTLIALRDPQLRARENLLARESSMYCSAFVQHLFNKAGIELAPGINGKNTTPEDISRTEAPHVTYLLKREIAPNRLVNLKGELRQRVRARIDKIKKARRES